MEAIGRKIVLMEFGSHVYGTNVPTSDRDYKGIIVPSGSDILLQKAGLTSVQQNTKKDPGAKNTKDDVDMELFLLQGFFRLCAEGQTGAIDMLFTPKSFIKESSEEWEFIQANRAGLIHRGTGAFVGYCQQQAGKYGLKGSYIAALRKVIELLETFDPHDRLFIHDEKLRKLAQEVEHVEIIQITHPKTLKTFDYLKVRNCKVEFNCIAKYAIDIYKDLLDKYGERARQAETNDGVDFKALMHAVRVCHEAVELLRTGHVTFPRPEKDLLLAIRTGQMPYREIAPIIEEGVRQVDIENAKSNLPEKIDLEKWNAFTREAYLTQVVLEALAVQLSD